MREYVVRLWWPLAQTPDLAQADLHAWLSGARLKVKPGPFRSTAQDETHWCVDLHVHAPSTAEAAAVAVDAIEQAINERVLGFEVLTAGGHLAESRSESGAITEASGRAEDF